MFDDLINKKVEIYLGSNSGCGVSIGGSGGVVSSVILISGIIVNVDDNFLYLQNAQTFMLNQASLPVFGGNKMLTKISSDNTIVSRDKILFINY